MLSGMGSFVMMLQEMSEYCTFQEFNSAIQHFRSEGYEQSPLLHDWGA